MKYLVIISIFLAGCYTPPKESLSEKAADLKAAGWHVTKKSSYELHATHGQNDLIMVNRFSGFYINDAYPLYV